MVGLPDKELPGMMAQGFGEFDLSIWRLDTQTLLIHGALLIVSNAANLSGSHIGSKAEVIEMLQGAADKGIKTWIQELPMSKAGEAVQGVKDNKVRYRFVLKNDLE